MTEKQTNDCELIPRWRVAGGRREREKVSLVLGVVGVGVGKRKGGLWVV
jgi:hypothetical protein